MHSDIIQELRNRIDRCVSLYEIEGEDIKRMESMEDIADIENTDFVEYTEDMGYADYVEYTEDMGYADYVEYTEDMEYTDYVEYTEDMEYTDYVEYTEDMEYTDYVEYTEYVEEPEYVETTEYEEEPEYVEYAECAEYIEEPECIEYAEYEEEPVYVETTEYVEEPVYIEPTEYEEEAEYVEPVEGMEEPDYEQVKRFSDRQEAEIISLRKKLYYKNFWQILRNTVSVFVTLIAVVALVFTFYMPVLYIYGNSMFPTYEEGDIVLTIKTSEISRGEVIAFYFNNQIWVKRVIAKSGDWVDIDAEGNVYVNGEMLQEYYVAEKALSDCTIELPYQVPDKQLFVLGDSRNISLDSRNAAIGCVTQQKIIGKVLFKIWPLF